MTSPDSTSADLAGDRTWASRAGAAGFRALVEASPDGLMLLEDEVIQYCNPAGRSLLGAAADDQVLNRSLAPFLAEECRPGFQEQLAAIRSGTAPAAVRSYRLLRLDDREVDVEIRGAACGDRTGAAVQLILRDVTERLADERLLNRRLFEFGVLNRIGEICGAAADQDELLRSVTETIADNLFPDNCGFLLLDETQQVLRPHSSFVLSSPHVVRADIPIDRGLTGKAARTGKPVRVGDVRSAREYLAADSRSRSELSVPMFVCGQVAGVLNIESDSFDAFSQKDERLMTAAVALVGQAVERLRARAAEQSAHHFSQQIVACAKEGVIVVGRDGRYLVWNPFMEQLSGLPASQVLGRRPEDVLPFLKDCGVLEASRRALAGETVEMADNQFHLPWSGRTVWTSETHTPLRSGDGEIIGGIVIVRDVTARKTAELALADAQRRLSAIMEGASVGVWEWDLTTNAFQFSREWRSRLGYGESEDGGFWSDWEQRIHPHDLPLVLEAMQRAIATGLPCSLEFRVRHSGGEWWWFFTRGFAVYDGQSRPVRLVGMHIDITDRRQAEDALRKTQQQLHAVVEQAPAILWAVDRELRYTLSLGKGLRGLGLAPGQVVGSTVDECIGAAPCKEMVIDQHRRALAGESLEFSVDFGGRVFECRLEPLRAADGELIGCLGVGVDVTEQRIAERAIAEGEARLRTLLENLEGIAVQGYEPDGRITFWNRASEKFYGYTAAEAIGLDLVELLHDEPNRPAERKLMAEALASGSSPGSECEVVRRDGSKFWVLATRIVHPRAGRLPEFFCFDVDITAIKEAQSALANRQAELLHASRLHALGEMVAGLSHEVAQPLSAIGNFAAATRRIVESEPLFSQAASESALSQQKSALKYLEMIARQNDRCGQILGRLREFSRKAPDCRTPCDINQVLLASLELIANELRSHDVHTRLTLAPDLPPVEVNRVQIEQVVVNLLANARDAVRHCRGARRVVDVETYADGEGVVIEVRDRGVGLSEEVARRMFEPFYTTKEHGMGIGLGICQSIVAAHRGRIEALSNEEGGATLRVWLPAKESVAR